MSAVKSALGESNHRRSCAVGRNASNNIYAIVKSARGVVALFQLWPNRSDFVHTSWPWLYAAVHLQNIVFKIGEI